MLNLKGRSFLTLLDFTVAEVSYLLDLSQKLKHDKKAGKEMQQLKGKNICLLFQKDSTRTRAAFEVAAADQGASTVYFGPAGSHFGSKESVEDSAKVLGRMFDAIQYRGSEQTIVELLAKHSGVPVWNGLTNEFHPTQGLADLLTAKEALGSLKGKRVAFFGDAKNNVAITLMIVCAKLGVDYVGIGPKSYWPPTEMIKKIQMIADETGSTITFTDDAEKGSMNVDVFYTDVWVSMGESKKVWAERVMELSPYQITTKLMKLGTPNAIFLHCLPAFHDLETDVGKMIFEQFGIKEMEVTDEVFRSKASYVFQQAENRLHTIKAIVVATLGE